MLNLNKPLTLTKTNINSPNLCDQFDDADLKTVGSECWTGYDADKTSRAAWERRNEAGMDLALQIQKDKSFPWPGASNVAFPLVTIAALQFHARAYPALLNGVDIVRMRVVGNDADGKKTARAERISVDMSWQCLQQDKPWEGQQDKLLINLPIVGTAFKKSYNSVALRHNVSELVLAKDLVLNYFAKSVEECPRKTHLIPKFRNEIREKVLEGTYRDILEETWYTGDPTTQPTTQRTKQDNRQGVTPPTPDFTSAFMFGEQHVNMDLDEDGYAEPYIITFELNSRSVVRIVTRFTEEDVEKVQTGKRKGEIIRIKPQEYFTKYSFIPSPDGGIYDIGFGVFLGPLNESVNSLVNQLIDAGTMQTTAGGFLGRGAKIRGGAYTFAPLEWKRVDSTGDDLRKNIFPLPVRDPSAVLFQLLSLLINYTNRISGATDMMVGENPGQNTPAETSRTMVEMGQKIYTAIFKRVWRATKGEFEKLFKLNGIYADPQYPIGPGGSIKEDYLGSADDVVPSADPNITSDVQSLQQSQLVMTASQTMPGFDKDEATRRWLKAMKVDAIDKLFPGTKGQQPPKDPKILVQEMKNQVLMAQMASDEKIKIAELMNEHELTQAKIQELLAKAQQETANALSEGAYARVAELNAQINASEIRSNHLTKMIEQLLKKKELEIKEKEAAKPAKTV